VGLHLGCLGHCCNRHVHSKISEHQDSKPAYFSKALYNHLCIIGLCCSHASPPDICASPMQAFSLAPCRLFLPVFVKALQRVTHTQQPHSNSMLFLFGQSHCCAVARSPADVVLQTEDASDRLRDIIAPMAGGLSSALTPLKGMVR